MYTRSRTPTPVLVPLTTVTKGKRQTQTDALLDTLMSYVFDYLDGNCQSCPFTKDSHKYISTALCLRKR